MKLLTENIKRLRKENKLSQSALAQKINRTRDEVSNWEIERSEPDVDSIKTLAKFFGVSVDYMTGFKQVKEMLQIENYYLQRIPIYDRLNALTLQKVEMEKCIMGYEDFPKHLDNERSYFAWIVDSDRMEPRIQKGDKVIILETIEFKTGDVIVYLTNDEQGIAVYQKMEHSIVLQPTNTKYPINLFNGPSDMERKNVRLLGKVVYQIINYWKKMGIFGASLSRTHHRAHHKKSDCTTFLLFKKIGKISIDIVLQITYNKSVEGRPQRRNKICKTTIIFQTSLR